MVGAEPWWHGVLYQIYPRSFADSDDDGSGDIPGLRAHLEHLAWLGVEGIWLSPVTASPDADWGYDVSDYCAVQPDLGTMEDLEGLIADAGRLGIRVLLDLVPNHTSEAHPWFRDALLGRDAAHRDFYVWADPRPDGSRPNNWMSPFGGPAWTLEPGSGQYYLHNFLPAQPDLNWWNPEVGAAFLDILRFWFDRGVAGFRIDVCHSIVKDAELRDNPPATDADPLMDRLLGQRPVYTTCRPEVHEVLQEWRALADTYDEPRVLVGETLVHDLDALMPFYGSGTDELHLPFNFVFLEAPAEADALRAVVEATEARLPAGAWPVWTASNHDVSRMATRWAGDDPARVRALLLMLLTLRGTAFLYQGDEIGLGDVTVPRDELRDPVGQRFWPAYAGRDAERTPMPWAAGPGGGFTSPGVRPWLPLGDSAAGNVADQRRDPSSVLHLVRDLIGLRRDRADLASGAYESVAAPSGAWLYRRGVATVVALDLGERPVVVDLPAEAGRVLLATDRRLEGSTVVSPITLEPWSGLVVDIG